MIRRNPPAFCLVDSSSAFVFEFLSPLLPFYSSFGDFSCQFFCSSVDVQLQATELFPDVKDRSVQCNYTLDIVDDLLLYRGTEFALNQLTDSSEVSSGLVLNRDFVRTSVFNRMLSTSQSLHMSGRSHGLVLHTQSSFESDPKGVSEDMSCRDKGINVTPSPVHRAEVGLTANLTPMNEELMSPRERYHSLYRSGYIAESQMAVCPSTRSTQTQTAHTVPLPLGQTSTRSMRTQTDLLDWDMSESTTKLNPTVVEIRIDSSEEMTQSVNYRSNELTYDRSGPLVTETYSPEQSPHDSYRQSIRCRVRQRTAQYELLEARRATTTPWHECIKEVVSPITGYFAPVSTAVRAGWLELGERNVYVNPHTGLTLPVEAALTQGLIRLNDSETDTESYDPTQLPSLLLIERISFCWHPVRITGFTDTTDGRQYSIEEALQRGFIHISTGEPLIWDREGETWISTEEAAGRDVIRIEQVDSDESDSSLLEETYSCRVFRVTSVRPGGEPSNWLDPIEAARIGLFNWQTGEVAAEWQARPELPTKNNTDNPIREGQRFVPTRWCSLLTARKARWLRLQAELHPMDWIPSMPDNSQIRLGHRILATHVHLVAPSTIPVSPPITTEEINGVYREHGQTQSQSSSWESGYRPIRIINSDYHHDQQYADEVHSSHHIVQSPLISSPLSTSAISSRLALEPVQLPSSRVEDLYNSTSKRMITERENMTTTTTTTTTNTTEALLAPDSDEYHEDPTEIEVNRMNSRVRSASRLLGSHRWLGRHTQHRARSDAALEQIVGTHTQFSRHERVLNQTDSSYVENNDHSRMYRSEQYLQQHEETEYVYMDSRFQHWDEEGEPMI